MKTRQNKNLIVRRETIKDLATPHLAGVAGGGYTIAISWCLGAAMSSGITCAK